MLDAQVYYKTTGAPIPGETVTIFGETSKQYAGIDPTKEIVVKDSDIAADGNIKYSSNKITAVADSTNHTLTLKLTEDLIIEAAPTAAEVTYAVRLMDGLELLNMKQADGTALVLNTDYTKDPNSETYYVKESSNLHFIEVKPHSTSRAVATTSADFDVAYWSDVYHTKVTPVNDVVEVDSHTGSLTADLYVHEAVLLDFDASANGVQFNGDPVNQSNWESFWVAPNKSYSFGGTDTDGIDALGKSALGASAAGKFASANIITGNTLTVGTTDMKLWGLNKVTLADTTDRAIVNADNAEVASGEYVSIGTALKAASKSGKVLIDTASNNPFALNNTTSITVGPKVGALAAATKITLKVNGTAAVHYWSELRNQWMEFAKADSSADKDVYVLPGTEIMVTVDSNTVKFDATTPADASKLPTVSRDDAARALTFTVNDIAVTLDKTT